MGRKTLDNVFTIEWAGQEKKTVLIPSRSSDEYMRGRVDEEDDREERMVSRLTRLTLGDIKTVGS